MKGSSTWTPEWPLSFLRNFTSSELSERITCQPACPILKHLLNHVHKNLTRMYTCQLFLSQMREILVSLWPGFPKTFRRLPKIADDFLKTSERYRKCPKMVRYLKLFRWLSNVFKRDISARFDTVRTQTRHQAPFIGIFSSELNWIWTSCPDLWVRREKLSSMRREIDVFDPRAWDSRIMRESWQV